MHQRQDEGPEAGPVQRPPGWLADLLAQVKRANQDHTGIEGKLAQPNRDRAVGRAGKRQGKLERMKVDVLVTQEQQCVQQGK